MYTYRSHSQSRGPHVPNSSYRYELTRDLLMNLSHGECCTVVGVGSCGKSRLLRHLANPSIIEYHLNDAGYNHFIVLVECNSWQGDSIWAAYEGLARSISEMMENVNHPIINSARREMSGLYSAVINDRDIAFAHLRTGLDYLFGFGPLHLTLCFDEFDFVFERFDTQLFRNLRSLRDAFKYRLTYLLATRKPIPYQRPVEQWPDVEPFYELFSNTLYAGPYNQGDAEAMLSDLEQRFSYRLQPRARELIYKTTGGHPGMIGAAFRHIVQTRALPTRPQDMDTLLREPALWTECRKIWEPLDPLEWSALGKVARGARLSRDEIQVLEILKLKGLVQETNSRGRLVIFSDVFREFVLASTQ
jgi:hypothetical protein